MKVRTLMQIFILFACTFFASVTLFAQENETQNNIRYSNITEFGFFATSPKSVFAEGTTVHGISINNQHNIGIGIGFGGGAYFSNNEMATSYMPMFLNYRLHFLPDKKLSPHINIALGGLMTTEGGGMYTSLTAGFRAGHFSFSSGFSCLLIQEKRDVYDYDYDPYYSYTYTTSKKKVISYFPMGLTIKCGFSF